MKKSAIRIFLLLFAAITCLAAYDAYSKRGGFSSRSSFSSGSSRSKSFSFSDRSSKKSTYSKKPSYYSKPKITKKKPTVKTEPRKVAKHTSPKKATKTPHQPKKVAKKQFKKPEKKFGANVKRKQKVAASKDAYRQQKSAFKTRTNTSSKRYADANTKKTWNTRDNSTLRRASTYDRSTYYTRRSNYYNDWHTPSYAYNSYSSFGVWDSIALWYMLDNIHNPHYASMYYHQMNTPGMQSWRLEASRMENAELRAKLAKLDAKVDQMERQGVKRDTNYLPPNVDVDIFLSEEAREASKPVLKICTGEIDKNYHAIGTLLASNAKHTDIKLVPTKGSAENLRKLDSGECDAALAQRDSYIYHLNTTSTADSVSKLAYNRLFSPYNEVVHLVCHLDSGIEDLTDLKGSKKTVIIGANGSGSNITWNNLVAEEEKYGSVKTLAVSGAMAKSSLNTKDADCLLSVSGLKTDFMKTIMDMNKGLELVEWNDNSLKGVIDPAQKKVYHTFTLPKNVYPSIQIDNKLGWFNTSTEVALVPADFIVAKRWAKAHEQTFERFAANATKQLPQIRALTGSK